MKKALLSIFIIAASVGATVANTVTPITAQTAATNFYAHNFKTAGSNLTLVYTELANDGKPAYYVFNINGNNGFVIVSAEIAAHPILAYSNAGQYVAPDKNNNVAWWLNCRKQEITYARANNVSPSQDVLTEWNNCLTNTFQNNNVNRIMSVSPLVSSTWNQNGGGAIPYNNLCPGGSVTGCVATAMAQIIRYWQYPAHGHGYNSYWDEQWCGFQQNWGHLYANFDTSNYVWAQMPLGSSTNYVAQLMYDCGVSVCMDYSGGGSAAWVINGDYPISAQNAYVKYFGYNPATVQGVYKSNYNYSAWLNLIDNELNNNRPVQYVGNDSVNNAGHTWVCDGYDVSNNFHMNWGWGGADNGYYAANALYVIGYNFNWWDEAVIGIQPPALSPYFAGAPTFGCSGLTVNFKDSSVATVAISSYKWLFPGGSPNSSALATPPAIVYNTPGTYDVTEILNGTDTIVRKAYISVASTGTLPLVQNFQSPTFPPAGWVINNPHNSSYAWQLNNGVGGFGASSQCMEFNNAQAWGYWATIKVGLWTPDPGKAAVDVAGQRLQIYTPEYNFTGVVNPTVYFDVAYAPYTNTLSDTLIIYYSTDCGATFHKVYTKGGMTLGTTGNTVRTGADTNSKGVFVPLSNNWRTDTIHIPAIAGLSGVMFSFENRSGNGSPIYIDNINIPGVPLNVADISNNPSVSVFPNPSNGQFTIGVTNVSGTPSVKIYNIIGQEVYQARLKSGNEQINLNTQPKGVYIYKVYTENGSSISTGKLVID